jgi:pimeloyl-ACP methyl ester carboxylesterase
MLDFRAVRALVRSMAAVTILAGLAGTTGCGDSQMLDRGAHASPHQTETPGVPRGGPDVLYAPLPVIPQLQNRDPRFRAAFEMVSGTERYIDGEYLYTDFLYDDEGTTYPDDFDRYAGNAADLVEFRIATPVDGGMAVRFTLNTLVVPDSTIAIVAFDSDNDASTGSSTLPRDPGMPFPGTDQVLTTWGTGAEWSNWNGSGWNTAPLTVNTDLEANQITVTVPATVAEPRGQWRATLALGLFDPITGEWLPLGDNAPKIVNLGFRFNEVAQPPPREPLLGSGGAPYDEQTAALSAAEPTRFANLLDFELLRSGGTRDNVPTHGTIFRMFASHLPSVTLTLDEQPGEFGDRPFFEGKNRDFDTQYLSPLQPYVIYVPSGYEPAKPIPLTFYLHGWGGEYFELNGSTNYIPLYAGEARNSIVLAPAARGSGGFYVGDLEYDLMEAWNDVAHHYSLDPQRTTVTGVSMGGYGAYRLALLYPHLFARVVPIIPAISRGIWIPGVSASGGEQTLSNRWVENARNLPVFHIADMASELTFYPGQAQQAIGPAVNGLQSLESNGYRYRFRSVAIDHLAIGTNFPEITDFLGEHVIEPEPFHVTYARMPSNDHATRGVMHNKAYWLSEIELRDANATLAKGVIDAVSLGFGKIDPTSSRTIAPGVTAGGWAYVETQRTWGEAGRVPVENRIVINATNIATVAIDPVAARVDCNVHLDIESDGPIEVRLRGCSQ